MTPSAALRRAAELQTAVQLVELSKRSDLKILHQAWRSQDRWLTRWERWAEGLLNDMHRSFELKPLIGEARGGLFKRRPEAERIASKMRQQLPIEEWTSGALSAYVGMSLDEGEDAGQYALDQLGLNRTFRWAHPRVMGRDIYAVRGSKIVQGLYGSHIDKLADIVLEATDYAEPKTIGEITRRIREAWPRLARWQAERIARTEMAAVWETTNLNTMVANQVQSFKWLVASGPSIGTRTADVCPICLGKAARNPYTLEQLHEIPPAHPNCRCTLLPILDGWLPPTEPWTGGDLVGPTRAPDPGGGVALGGPRMGFLRGVVRAEEFFATVVPDAQHFGRILSKDGTSITRIVVESLNAPTRMFPIKQLIATVQQLSAEMIQQIVAGVAPGLPSLPTIAIIAGAYYVVSGHEQIAAQAAQGQTEVEARYVEVS